jgi:hypothetical protein
VLPTEFTVLKIRMAVQLERNAKQIVERSGEASTSIITGVTLGRLMFAWFKSGDFGEAYCR